MHAIRLARWLPILVGATLVATASAAGAATICVQNPACPAGAETQPTIANALAAASGIPGLDHVLLGPGTFAEGGLAAAAGNPVDVVGAGNDQTAITPAAGNSVTTLRLDDPASTLSDVTVDLASGTTDVGLALSGTARRVTVTGAGVTNSTAVKLSGSGAFLSGTISMPTAGGATGVDGAGGGTLADSSVTAALGASNVAVVQRVRIAAVRGIIADASSGSVVTTVDDALVQIVDTGVPVALAANAGGFMGSTSATLTARHVTAIGNGVANAVGVQSNAFANSFSAVQTASVSVSSTVLQGFAVDLKRAAGSFTSSATAIATLTIGSSDINPFSRVDTNTAPMGTASGAISDGGGNIIADPGFRDAAGGDFALRGDSPLIDHGDAAAPAIGEPATDLAGNPRVVDGNGDGSAIADIGAYEYVPPPPTPPPGGPPPPPPPGGPPPASTANGRPTLGALSLAPARFVVGPGATARSAARHHAKPPPRGTTIHFTLSRAATVKLTIQSPAAGRRAGRSCVKPTRKLRKAKRCTRLVSVFSFTRDGTQGANAVTFSGRAGTHPLAPGPYRLLATATADQLSSAPRSTRFTILKR